MPKPKDTAPPAPTVDDLFKPLPPPPPSTDKPAEPVPTATATDEERPTGESPGVPEQPPAPQPEQPAQAASSQAMIKREPLPLHPQNADDYWRYAVQLSKAELIPKSLRGKPNDVWFVLLKGHDLGLRPTQSIASIHIIDGKAEVGALLMVSLILKSGLCAGWELVKSDERSSIYRTKRVGGERWIEFEYTIEEAAQMGLLDKGKDDWAKANNQWKKQPRTMLRRRGQSSLAREVYPDIVLGLYDHEELSEIREVADRLGLREDQVTGAIDAVHDQPSLAEPTEGPIAKVAAKAADPLKARMAAKVAGSRVRRCSSCQEVLDPRDSDPCIVCRPDSPTTEVA